MPDANWLDRIEKAYSAMSLELKDIKLSLRKESNGQK